VISELTWAGRLVASLLDEHWAEIVSEAMSVET
jgi:hypothetical protein